MLRAYLERRRIQVGSVGVRERKREEGEVCSWWTSLKFDSFAVGEVSNRLTVMFRWRML